MSAETSTDPNTMHNYEHNGVVHEHVLLLAPVVESVPRIPKSKRLSVEYFDGGVTQVVARFGFAEKPDIGALFRESGADDSNVSFFRGTR